MGSGALRAAVKVASGGLQGITSEQYPLFSATRGATSARPAVGTVDNAQLEVSRARMASSEIGDWILVGGEEEAVVSDGDRMPRVVYGRAPTLEEAKEATSELAVTLENFSDSSSQVVPSVNVIKAFKFLHESTAAQNVVASIACDPNVWNAVLQNDEFQQFLRSQETSMAACSNLKQSYDDPESLPDSGFTLVDMMCSLSNYFDNFFGSAGSERELANSDGRSDTCAGTLMEASFMGLAMTAILVILLKRV